MDNNKKKDEELQSRREFFKKLGKGVLPILGAAVLSAFPMEKAEAQYGCPSLCSSACTGGCDGTCSMSCYKECYTGCNGSCSGSCNWNCTSYNANNGGCW